MKVFRPIHIINILNIYIYIAYIHIVHVQTQVRDLHIWCASCDAIKPLWHPQSLKFSTGQCLVHRLGVLKVLVSRRRRVRIEGRYFQRVSFCRSSKRTKLPKQRRATQLEEKMDPKHAMKLLCSIKSNLKQLHRLQTSSSLLKLYHLAQISNSETSASSTSCEV